jgi:hypothetical protein
MYYSYWSSILTLTVTDPLQVNLIELVMRLIRICFILFLSEKTSMLESSNSIILSSFILRSLAKNWHIDFASKTSSWTENHELESWNLSKKILDWFDLECFFNFLQSKNITPTKSRSYIANNVKELLKNGL